MGLSELLDEVRALRTFQGVGSLQERVDFGEGHCARVLHDDSSPLIPRP